MWDSALWEWLTDNGWAAWLIAALVLLLVELMVTDLIFLMLASGAATGGIVNVMGGSLWVQLAAFVSVCFVMLTFVRPLARRNRTDTDDSPMGVAALIGQEAVVLETVSSGSGLVRILHENWTARSAGPTSLPVDSTVRVVAVEGAILRVEPA